MTYHNKGQDHSWIAHQIVSCSKEMMQTFEQDDQKNKDPPFATPTIAMPPPTTLATPMPSPTIPINIRHNRVSIVLPHGKWIDQQL